MVNKTNNTMKNIKLIAPPEGWKYGFPKQYIESDGTEPVNLTEWLVRNGYPQSEIDSYGKDFYCQWTKFPIEKKVVTKQIYTFEFVTYDDGSTSLTRINEGFEILELLGLLNLASLEIMETLRGNIKPDVINRQVVKDE